MVFARRHCQVARELGHEVEEFHLLNRNSILGIVRDFISLRNILRSRKFDYCVAHYGTITGILVALASLGICASAIIFRGSDLNPRPGENKISAVVAHVLSQLAALIADASVCVSKELEGRLWWRNSRTTVLPTGVDIGVFHPMDIAEARRQLGWAVDKPVVVFNAGGRPVEKRLDLVVDAISIVRKGNPDVTLHVLNGMVEPDLVPVIFAASDCLVLASDYEGSPTVVQEAMAVGTPVVSVPVGDVREVLAGVSPSFITGRTPVEIANAITQIVAAPTRSNGPTQVSQSTALPYVVTRFVEHLSARRRARRSFWKRHDQRFVPGNELRILSVMPVTTVPHGMIFARRQMESLRLRGNHLDEFPVVTNASLPEIWMQYLRLRAHIRSTSPDVVLSQYGTITGLITALASRTQAPVAIYFRGSDLNPWWQEGIFRTIAATVTSQLAALLADHVICVSKSLSTKLWTHRRSASIIPSGVDTGLFKPISPELARSRLGWEHDEKVVLFNGGGANPRALKRVELAYSAISHLSNEIAGLRLHVLGTVLPEDMPLYYAAARCLVLTSVHEGSPNVVKEAAACGLPVVTVAVGDVREVLKDVEPSWITDSTVPSIAAALRQAIKAQRSNGPEVVEARLALPIIAGRVEDALKAMVRRYH